MVSPTRWTLESRTRTRSRLISLRRIDEISLEWDCAYGSGDTISGGDVLDGTYDCMDGSDEDSSSENEDFRNRVDEQNKTLQTHKIYGALSFSGGIILLVLFLAICSDVLD